MTQLVLQEKQIIVQEQINDLPFPLNFIKNVIYFVKTNFQSNFLKFVFHALLRCFQDGIERYG